MSRRVHPLSHPGTAGLVNLVALALTVALFSGFLAAAVRLST